MAILVLAVGLNYVDRTSISVVFPLIRADLHATDVQLCESGSFFLWSYAVASPFAGMLADRFSRSGLIVVSLAAWSLIMTLCGFVSGIQQLLALRVLLGLAESLYVPAAVTLIAVTVLPRPGHGSPGGTEPGSGCGRYAWLSGRVSGMRSG